jgi:peptidoglycan/xylan/chitin deacetylase (PgdA/CDA1 family)
MDDSGNPWERCLIYPHGVRTGNSVALTFDDGPNPPRTEQVLALLAEAKVHATFFVIGKWVERFPESVRRISAGGHLIGNHGYSGRGHIGDYDEAETVISHLTGMPCRFFRAHTFDYGAYFQSVVSSLPDSRVVHSDVRAIDYQITDPNEIIHRVLDDPALGPGSIINLHDGGEMDDAAIRLQQPLAMIAALPHVIAGLTAKGLRCVRLDEMELAEPVEWTAPRTTRRNRRIGCTLPN